MDKFVCIEDFAKGAREVMALKDFEYFSSGSDDQVTVQENRDAFLRWLIRPRVLRDVSSRCLETSIFGSKVAFPVGVSPTAFQRVAHPDGEVANARAASDLGTIFILSTFATSSMEEVAKRAPGGRKWFQLFMPSDRNLAKKMLERAEEAGFEAIVWTLDAQEVGRRRTNQRNQFHLPGHLSLANFIDLGGKGELAGGMAKHVHDLLKQNMTWDDLIWLKKATRLPVIVKGIYNVEDADMACHLSADAVIVTNHGGRQVDTVSTTIDLLPRVVAAVRGRCPVFLDGGVSRGSDVFKALALGAKMVFIGRSMIWGLAVGGEDGARRVLEILRDELDLTMALAGVANINDINRNYVMHKIESIKSSI